MGYHEWLSIQRNEPITCLNWIAGGSFIAGIIYFTIDSNIFPGLKHGLIDVVAAQSTALLNIMGLPAIKEGESIVYQGTPITIIFACTAIQSMVLFVGMIGALGSADVKRKVIGITITVVPIYLLNLVRNASVIFLVGGKVTSFTIAHNYLSKAGALITLIVLLFITFKILPELYDEISCIIDLPKRNGPVENLLRGVLRGRR
jgi:archaeosortase A (PGF-CTERM-specific)